MIFYSLIGGTVAGTYWATVAPVTAEVVGLRYLPAALSITWLNLVLPTTFSEPIGLEITAKGKYIGAQVWAGVMYLVAAFCLWLLKAWKIGEIERAAAIEEKRPGVVDSLQAAPSRNHTEMPLAERRVQTSSFTRRLFMWKRV